MTTPTITQIYQHASVRSYKPDPIPREMIETIVAAGLRSSTSSNLHMVSAIAITDAAKREQLAELCGQQKHIRQAPVFLAWCADLSRLERICQWRGYEQVADYVENFLLAAVDTAIFMQTAALAAESLGLGMCYIGAIRNNPQQVIDLLALPRLVFPISGMTLGWPSRPHSPRPKLPVRAVLHWETYQTAGEASAWREYDEAMIATGIYQGRQVAIPGQSGEMEAYGWSEHSARRVTQPYRVGLRDVLEKQGFALQ